MTTQSELKGRLAEQVCHYRCYLSHTSTGLDSSLDYMNARTGGWCKQQRLELCTAVSYLLRPWAPNGEYLGHAQLLSNVSCPGQSSPVVPSQAMFT